MSHILFDTSMPITQKLFYIVAIAIALLISLPFHEFAHALAAYKLGDKTAKYQGRLTINPFAHLSLFGTLMLVFTGFGFAKPVPINPYNFKNRKAGMALTSLAGPVSNMFLAFVFLILYKILVIKSFATPFMQSNIYGAMSFILSQLVMINIGLAIFNLLPIPPLDGSRILTLFLPEKYYFQIMQYEQYIMMGLFLLLFAGVLDGPLYFLRGVLFDVLDFLTSFIDVIFRAI